MIRQSQGGIVRAQGIGQRLKRGFLFLVLALFCVYYLAPLVVMVSTSLKSLEEIRQGTLISLPQSINFEAWAKAWTSACVGVRCDGLAPYVWNSVLMAVPAVAISTFLGALNGFALTKWRFRGADVIFALMLFGAFIPFQVVLLPMARTLGVLGLAGTVPGLILVHTVYGLAFTTLFFRNFFIGVSDGIVRAAQVDGASFFGIFFRIILPMSLPAIVVTLIWQFTQIWNDFLFGIAFTVGESNPVTVALNNVVNTSTGVKEYNVDMAAAIIAALPTLAVYVLAGSYFVRGLSAGAVKG
ncbi:MAG: carbohydrate ABC transporter permease [Phaeovulum sp.]|jgi:glucose/mannose transport system permease protein|uniref:carbohydrate ABC transporter permease n=1 Tax=Phaeovulum sp. TaxID=2934796 RepID=UPI00273154B6|nr:carbohydrate ABC transporter permease [Phaeovulum sp.]MDP2063784.1 carbohydrate ABC transporter permease [Phaeovulum sp.]MDP3860598.1 carbohydrate ABC transporter permease [Phaeovulum sp.]